MIEDTIKDNIIAIICYCDTDEKINILVDNINLIRDKYTNFKIAIQSNYPLPEHIQKMVDIYIYQDLNFVFDFKQMLLWNKLPYFNKKFIYYIKDYGFSVFQMIKHISKYLIEYKKVLLMNYDVVLEDTHVDNHLNLEYDLIVYDWKKDVGFNLILMSFVPLVFSNKICNFFTYDSYVEIKNMVAEERFYEYVKKSDINYVLSKHNVVDKMHNTLSFDTLKNDFFSKNFICYNKTKLEIYLWYLYIQIEKIKIKIDENEFLLTNKNIKGAFENNLLYEKEILNINIIEINDTKVNIPLEIIKNSKSEFCVNFEFSYDSISNKLRIFTMDELKAKILIWNRDKTDLIYSTISIFNNNRLWYMPSRSLYDINNILIEIKDIDDILVKEEYMTLNKNKDVELDNGNLKYLAGGMLGDFIYQLSIIKEKYLSTGKKGDLYLVDKFLPGYAEDWPCWKLGANRAYDDLKDIILSQEYISSFKIYDQEKFLDHVHLSSWRQSPLLFKNNFYEIFKKEYGVEWGSHKWLDLPEDKKYNDYILVSTSIGRYNNFFDFNTLHKYNKKIYYATTDIKEYENFKIKSNCDFELLIFDSLIDYWIAINSCYLFVSTYSSFLTIAHALHKNHITLMPNNHEDIHLVKNMPNLKWYKNEEENNLIKNNI